MQEHQQPASAFLHQEQDSFDEATDDQHTFPGLGEPAFFEDGLWYEADANLLEANYDRESQIEEPLHTPPILHQLPVTLSENSLSPVAAHTLSVRLNQNQPTNNVVPAEIGEGGIADINILENPMHSSLPLSHSISSEASDLIAASRSTRCVAESFQDPHPLPSPYLIEPVRADFQTVPKPLAALLLCGREANPIKQALRTLCPKPSSSSPGSGNTGKRKRSVFLLLQQYMGDCLLTTIMSKPQAGLPSVDSSKRTKKPNACLRCYLRQKKCEGGLFCEPCLKLLREGI
ncbi:hypothetical protein F5Y14DRAFT_398459 [Nemania sp. NC0429]|nr:hypothetical protein F5Y14DRAFT_398459 [Nemania sp. NC0429]